jgi:ABC-2 type transport system ATP-binding protein
MSKERYKRCFDELTESLELAELLHVPIRNMSLGQRMRAELATALIHDPKIVFLDEPTIGLDLTVKERIRQVIKNINETMNTTVFLTTHDLDDIEEICRRVIILDKGIKIYDGSLTLIKDRFGKHHNISFESSNVPSSLDLPTHTDIIERSRYRLTLRFNRQHVSASQVAAQIMTQMEVRDFSLTEPALHTIIKQIYEGSSLSEHVS